MKRPCYLAGGTTEREDPPSGSHVVTHTHTHNVHVRVKEGRSVAEKACVHARAGGPRRRDGVDRTRTGV